MPLRRPMLYPMGRKTPLGDSRAPAGYRRPDARLKGSRAPCPQESGRVALLRIRHLPLADGRERLLAHAGPRQHARMLHVRRGRHDQNRIAAGLTAGLEQERDVEHGHGRVRRERLRQEALFLLAHERMNDAFQPRHALGRADHLARQGRAVDDTSGRGSRKGRFDEGSGLAFVEAMHGRVGIVNRHAETAEDRRVADFPMPIEPVRPSTKVINPCSPSGFLDPEICSMLVRRAKARSLEPHRLPDQNASSPREQDRQKRDQGRPRTVEWSPAMRSNR